MRTPRAAAGVTTIALAAATLLAGPTASADPTAPAPAGPAATSYDAKGRGAGTAASADPLDRAEVLRRVADTAVAGDPLQMPTSYPYQPDLRLYRDNADDAAKTAQLLGHPDLAPRLLDLMDRSDRVSAQVVGQSSEGRDLYLVTLTAPETAAETAQQAAWKQEIRTDPDAAAADTALARGYKTPVWISNNIHGNEWEGTDAAMKYIEYLATAPITEVGSILANNRLYFSPSLNPDGRTNATRATALGLDPNRDMITNTTPETRSFIRTAQAIQPIYAADFHGYTNVLQMEPCGPPHGSNYEYDLYMPHNYALALRVERDVVAAAIPGNTYFNTTTRTVVPENTSAETAHIKIPYRDTPDGWDDFPPIFTAQYAAFYGAASATVELPLTRGAAGGRQTPERAVVNTAVALQTMKSIVGYMNVATNARDMIAGQIETFRRGVAGEPKDNLTTSEVSSVPGPTQWQPLWDVVDDQEPITLPRAYVIPVGTSQRSRSDADDLVTQLLLHEIEVDRLTAPATVGATTYPAGSYVVDMHQPLRGLANALLDLGEDISAKVPSMYDVSAWSLSYLWGASVDKVGLTQDPAPIGASVPVTEPPAPGAAPAQPAFLTFDLAGVADYRLLNALLEDGVAVSMLADGSAVVDRAGYAAAVAAADDAGVTLAAASADDLAALDDDTTKPLSDLTIGYVGTQDDRLSLTELGFDDLKALSVASLNATPALLDDVDVLWVASSFNPAVDSAARTAVQAFVDGGGALLGRTNQGFNAAVSFGLMTGTVTSGNGSGNGIVDVDTPEGSVLAPYAQDTAFIYPAYSFAPGEGVRVEQSYDAEDPFLAGHWRATTATNGPDFAAGKPAVVSSENATTGAKSLVFGTSVFFRTYPKGGLSQAARALLWAGPEGDPVLAPGQTSVSIAPVTPVRYPAAPSVTVTTAAGEGTTDGLVELLVGETVVASGPATGPSTTLSVPGLRPGVTSVVARFTPTSSAFDPSTSEAVQVQVYRAASALRLKAQPLGQTKGTKGRVKVTLSLAVPGVPTTGRVVLTSGDGSLRRTLTVTTGSARTITVVLPDGRRSLRATYAGSSLVRGTVARTTVQVR